MLVDGVVFRHAPAARAADSPQVERYSNAALCVSDKLVTTATTYAMGWTYTDQPSGNGLVHTAMALAPAVATGPWNVKTINGLTIR